jgi:DNA-binding transcriptional LysR family regulator
MELAVRYVKQGIGVAVCSEMSLATQGREGVEVIDLSHLMPLEQIGIVTVRERKVSPEAHDFIAAAKEVALSIRWRMGSGAALGVPFESLGPDDL